MEIPFFPGYFLLTSTLFGNGFAGPFFAGLQIEEVQPAQRVDFFYFLSAT